MSNPAPSAEGRVPGRSKLDLRQLRRAAHWVRPILSALGLAILWVWFHLLRISLRPSGLWSGIVLLALVLLLTLFNARKKLPLLPLFKASSWMVFHAHAGWLALFVFLLHIHFRLPRGGLEGALALLFVLVTLSGILGLVLSRLLPPRLARHGEEVLYERIPALRNQLREQAEKLVLEAVSRTDSSSLADYYARELKPFFEQPRSLGLHLVGSTRPLQARLAGLQTLDRFLNNQERATAATLAEFIRAKDNLDFHYACQGMLKVWLFVHIPLAYSLILLGLVHGFLAWSFTANSHL